MLLCCRSAHKGRKRGSPTRLASSPPPFLPPCPACFRFRRQHSRAGSFPAPIAPAGGGGPRCDPLGSVEAPRAPLGSINSTPGSPSAGWWAARVSHPTPTQPHPLSIPAPPLRHPCTATLAALLRGLESSCTAARLVCTRIRLQLASRCCQPPTQLLPFSTVCRLPKPGTIAHTLNCSLRRLWPLLPPPPVCFACTGL